MSGFDWRYTSATKMIRLRDRVVELLKSRDGSDLCVGCLAKTLAVPHKSAHESLLKLEAQPGFKRRYGQCSECGKTRIVTGYAAHATPAPQPVEGDG
jgi:hypothetical protein